MPTPRRPNKKKSKQSQWSRTEIVGRLYSSLEQRVQTLEDWQKRATNILPAYVVKELVERSKKAQR